MCFGARRLLLLYSRFAPLSIVKNIVLTGFGKITLLDLDTIDLSNLNRQFLFRKKDVKQSKALVCVPLAFGLWKAWGTGEARLREVVSAQLRTPRFTCACPFLSQRLLIAAQVAAQTAAPFNPNVSISPIYGNIKEPQYDLEWFKQFDIVLNALDNLGRLSSIAHTSVI
jgi:ubiquitin-like 1-activating enzyme E1 B